MHEFLVGFKDFAPVGAVVIFAWGVYQFYRSTEIGFRKPYWEKLLALYVDACSTTATLARTDNESDWNDARNNFWRLYLGPLCLVEDLQVEAAMVDFRKTLEETTFSDRDPKILDFLALRLAYACRDSLRTDWKVPLEQLAGQQPS